MKTTILSFMVLIFCSAKTVNSQFVTDNAVPIETASKLCEESTITTCDQCIRKHPDCAWCASSHKVVGVKRCQHKSKIECLTNPENPVGTINRYNNTPLSLPNTNLSISGAVQLQPQGLRIKLRKGESKKFNITFRKVEDYPVDLYYLMDLSHSMDDDLLTLQNLGEQLAKDIKSNVTSNIKMGFGTFVDKVMMPFASTVPEQLDNPCAKNQQSPVCAPPFGFKHQQNISGNLTNFRTSVKDTIISGNIDSPEGGFDALMQIAVCTREIGWRPEATHLVVVTTDASFHMALDGKLAAILEANDMKCHLEKGANTRLKNDIVYSKSKELDYPSIGQLRSAFQNYKIQPIFAVTKEVRSLYDGLIELIPNSYVGELNTDSSNIISIINTAYNQLKEKLEMTLGDYKPSEVDISYRVLCPSTKKWQANNLTCNQIKIGSEVVYEFTVTATSCPNADISANPVIFTSNSLREDVKIFFDILCTCDCSKNNIPRSANCSTNGTLICGVCDCGNTHEGAQCQCLKEKANESVLDKCKKSKTTSSDTCEGHGNCECGVCNCNDGYFGKYCECSNKGCPSSQDKICGGILQGVCHNCNNNPTCNCTNGWTKSAIGTCSCNDNKCKANETDILLCSGNGKCECDECICNSTYTGKYCDSCIDPKCKPPQKLCDPKIGDCASCVFDQKIKNCSTKCNGINYETLQTIPKCTNCPTDCHSKCSEINREKIKSQPCTLRQIDSPCNIYFEVVWSEIRNDYLLLVQEFNKDRDCPPPPNVLLIVLPIVIGIVVVGVIALIAWKVYQTIRDKREWVNFENEMKKSKWTKDINPVFQKPTSRFENPSYGGDEQ